MLVDFQSEQRRFGPHFVEMAGFLCPFERLSVEEAFKREDDEVSFRGLVSGRGSLEAGVLFARAEGIVPAPEANHAVKGAIVEALRCKAEGRSEVILFNLCGHGHFDMQAYIDYFGGKLKDLDYDQKELAMALAGLPTTFCGAVPSPQSIVQPVTVSPPGSATPRFSV